jgi:hypothetical protein
MSPPWEAASRSATQEIPIKNFLKVCGTRIFITMVTRTLHWHPSWARRIQSMPPFLFLSSHLRLGLLFVSLILAFHRNHLFLLPNHACYTICPSNPSWHYIELSTIVMCVIATVAAMFTMVQLLLWLLNFDNGIRNPTASQATLFATFYLPN